MFFLPMLPIFFVPLLSGFSSGGSFPKPLAKEKEQQLLLRLRDGTDAEKESAKQTLILHNLRLVAHIAKKYNNAQRESEELISIGIVGLIKAILSYDSEKSIRLATYASRCIENAILSRMRLWFQTNIPRAEISIFHNFICCFFIFIISKHYSRSFDKNFSLSSIIYIF